MVTIVTDVELKEGAERKWDAVMRSRMTGARTQRGWVGGQVLRSEEDPNKRVIVGTWKARPAAPKGASKRPSKKRTA